jgi:hypothetical protein
VAADEPQTSSPLEPADEPVPQSIRLVQVFVRLEAVAFVCGAVALVIATAVSTAHRLWIPLALAALMVGVGVMLESCARGLGGDRIGARTPIIMVQLLALPVGYSLGIQAHEFGYGIPVLVVAIAVLVLMFSPSARARLQ